ncbi:mitochondrial pyruvate carrier 4-like [Corylus avellana]|uniref:mitochondrial pyruvate carrier 4-like n=1 Tax=Corylus avellana TaxID=13451 RepID=UPI001E2168D9|nr:mitochondrial pyruvate carrier 4-like [Corylus avellana]
MAGSKLQAIWNHPAGPKTIHFWAPTSKRIISIANFADFSKPPVKISYPQQMAVTCTGLIWSRYSMVIIPKNWNLFSVNVAMAGTGLYQLTRKIKKVGVHPKNFSGTITFLRGKQLLQENDDKKLSGPT